MLFEKNFIDLAYCIYDAWVYDLQYIDYVIYLKVKFPHSLS